MAKWNTGTKNGMWKGGRSLSSSGYILIRVGTGHHLADVRGYAYEHRIVAEENIGRRLNPGEIVHHKNGDKKDNRPENLEVVPSIAHHRVRHRSTKSGRRNPGQANPAVSCECGCGESFERFDKYGRERRFIPGHNIRRVYANED